MIRHRPHPASGSEHNRQLVIDAVAVFDLARVALPDVLARLGDLVMADLAANIGGVVDPAVSLDLASGSLTVELRATAETFQKAHHAGHLAIRDAVHRASAGVGARTTFVQRGTTRVASPASEGKSGSPHLSRRTVD